LIVNKSAHRAPGITREAYADSPNPGEKLIGRKREDMERTLSGCLREQPFAPDHWMIVLESLKVLQGYDTITIGHDTPVDRSAGCG
jgi:hypothetical protein